ncbi:hypothetical protein QBC40DRAFT_349716 [Triangularia verruculosa]|uniref:Nephrocystin 3-like N-terminal domain-containing protein n=1 Tax=Triangularia verruculosa TaxID=2587418 RepID=A0AAN6XFD3_9PEZI|nr:hypothetical protein QBC40DRAFT_349716 [Triangularia verruculosa]
MSLIRAAVTRSKAEARLKDALGHFERDLTLDQQKTFRTFRTQADRSPPNISDVMQITAEIDQEVSKNNAFRGRCLGPRFTNFLESAQRFASIGDVILGGSQNLIACGVWSLVRFSLLLMASYSTFVEKLSILLMDAGRSAPRYQEMALLYPQSQTLRSNMCEYFTVVVRFCHQFVKFTKQSVFRQMMTFLNDQDIKNYQSELDKWAVSIKEEVSLLKSRSIEKHGYLFQAFMKLDQSHRRETTRIRILEYCSTYDHQTSWKEIRKAGNTNLLQRSTEYRNWRGANESSTLICQGKLGSGKSVLLANVVSDLSRNIRSARCPIAYFFCRHDIRESLKGKTLMGSLIRQLITSVNDLAKAERLVGQEHLTRMLPTTGVDFEMGYQLLQRVFPHGLEAYIIIDGLDECDQSERETVYSQLQALQVGFYLHVCVSVRLEPETALGEREHGQLLKRRFLSIPENNDDIADFIRSELTRCIESGKLTLGDPALVLKIFDALISRAQGMFLWVVLQIASLCDAKTDAEIHLALENLPEGLPETFSRILRKATATEAKNYQIRVLEIITAAYRPLNTEEFRLALSVIPGNSVWDPACHVNNIYSACHVNNIYSALATCGSLVEIDEESFAVRLIHHSVVQFLFGEFQQSSTSVLKRERAAQSMGDIVITYLSYDIFRSRVSRLVAPQIDAVDAPVKIVESLAVSQNLRSAAVKLLQSHKNPSFNVGEILIKHIGPQPNALQHHFHTYAKEYWLQHSRWFSYDNLAIQEMLRRVATQEIVYAKGEAIADWALKHRHAGILKASVEEPDWFALVIKAIQAENEEQTTFLLDEDIFSGWLDPIARRILMFKAALEREKPNLAIFRLLIEQTADFNAIGASHISSLLSVAIKELAIANLLESHMEHIVARRLGTYIDAQDKEGKTILHKAIHLGWHKLAMSLLDAGASIHIRAASGETPLFPAVEIGWNDIVSILLEKGATCCISDINGTTPLMIAAHQRHASTMALLLSHGADPWTVDNNQQTALIKVICGHEKYSAAECAELLLKKGDFAQTDSVDRHGRTAFSYAAEHGSIWTIRVLHKRGSRVNLADSKDQTPLSYAAQKGHKLIVEFLLTHGANVAVKDEAGMTPEEWAYNNGHLEIYQMIKDRSSQEPQPNQRVLRDERWPPTPEVHVREVEEDC